MIALPTRARLATLLLLALSGCFALARCSPDPQRPADPGGKPGGAPKGTALHFEPKQLDASDVAVGETLQMRATLVADAPIDWREVNLSSTCDCLTAEYAGAKTATRAELVVSVFGLQVEDAAAAGILAEDPAHKELAHLDVPVSVKRKPFVQPREVTIEKGPEGRFEFVVGQAFAHDAELRESILSDLDPSKLDETKITLLDFKDLAPERTEESAILRTRVMLTVVESALAEPFETEVPISFGEPPVQRRVKVRWPGR